MFEAARLAGAVGVKGGGEAADQTRDEDRVEVPEVVGAHLVGLEMDGGELVGALGAAGEDEQELVAFLLSRSPLDDQERADGRLDSEFFVDLAEARCQG